MNKTLPYYSYSIEPEHNKTYKRHVRPVKIWSTSTLLHFVLDFRKKKLWVFDYQ